MSASAIRCLFFPLPLPVVDFCSCFLFRPLYLLPVAFSFRCLFFPAPQPVAAFCRPLYLLALDFCIRSHCRPMLF